MDNETPTLKRRRSSVVQRRRGRKGGRPPKYRTIPPPEQAIPPKRKGGDGGTTANSPLVVFPVDALRWQKFCEAYGSNLGRVRPACDYAGLAREAVDQYFRWASEGREPYRTECTKALNELGKMAGHAGQKLVERNPMEALTRAYPEDYPRDVASGGAAAGPIVVLLPHERGERLDARDAAVVELPAARRSASLPSGDE